MAVLNTQISRRTRQRSTSRAAGICKSCAKNGTAASTPMAKLSAPSATAKHNQEYARSEGSHGLAGAGIEKDEPEDAAIFALGGLG